MPRKKKAAATKPIAKKPQTKTSFVLSLPLDTPLKQVVAKAREAGIEITEKHVSAVRSTAKKKAGKKRKPGRPKGSINKKTAATKAAAAPVTASAEAFRKLVVDLGVVRARAILSELEVGLAALIKGR